MKLCLTNEHLVMELLFEHGMFIRQCTALPSDVPTTYDTNGELFTLQNKGRLLPSSLFEIADISTFKDATEELCTVTAFYSVLSLKIRICFLNNLTDTISIIFQIEDISPAEQHQNYYFHSPFLSSLHLNQPQTDRIYYPASPVPKGDGLSAIQLHPLIHLPLVLTDKDDGVGLSVSFPAFDEPEAAAQNRNLEFQKISSSAELKSHSFLLRLNEFPADIAEFSICGLSNGWCEAFNRVRKDFRETLDLREYKKETLSWFQNTFLHHFTFLYSKESYDYDAGKPDIAQLANDGMEFGGYDTMTLWHQYPRLGVDPRTQWDFFRDFPGSLQGIAAVVRIAHQNGIKVLLPYKPWDISNNQSMDDVLDEICALLKDTDADGFFLDTMSQISHEFRANADKIKPETVFCSELHPDTKDSLAVLTASWDQFWNVPCMPEVDLLRFVLPEHTAPQISRWQNGDEKNTCIKRAIFSGTGIVIWQDVFGAWLPYSQSQKAIIKKYKSLWMKFKNYFQGPEPIPCYPTERDKLYCNRFTDLQNTGSIYTFYNDSDKDISGFLIQHKASNASHCSDIWDATDFEIDNHRITGAVRAKNIAIIYVH